jgi:hypothetical protein
MSLSGLQPAGRERGNLPSGPASPLLARTFGNDPVEGGAADAKHLSSSDFVAGKLPDHAKSMPPLRFFE